MSRQTWLIMRHAKSSWSEEGLADIDRPLNARGNRTAPLMARYLIEKNFRPERMILSSALRTRQTADLMQPEFDFQVQRSEHDELYLASPQTWLEKMAEQAGDSHCVLTIGHNPGIEMLLFRICGVYESMPTAAVAVVDLLAGWEDITSETCELIDIYRPKKIDLDC